MSAVAPSPGSGLWSVQLGAATITNATSPTTTITGITAGNSATLRWTVGNGVCATTFEDIILTNTAAAPTADARPVHRYRACARIQDRPARVAAGAVRRRDSAGDRSWLDRADSQGALRLLPARQEAAGLVSARGGRLQRYQERTGQARRSARARDRRAERHRCRHVQAAAG